MLVLLLLLILTLTTGILPIGVSVEFSFPQAPEAIERVSGDQAINIIERDNVYKEFGYIGGNARVDVETDTGNIYIHFKDRITGNSKVNITSRRGNIIVRFEKGIEGNAKVTIRNTDGNITFVGKQSTIEKLITGDSLKIITEGNISFKTSNP